MHILASLALSRAGKVAVWFPSQWCQPSGGGVRWCGSAALQGSAAGEDKRSSVDLPVATRGVLQWKCCNGNAVRECCKEMM